MPVLRTIADKNTFAGARASERCVRGNVHLHEPEKVRTRRERRSRKGETRFFPPTARLSARGLMRRSVPAASTERGGGFYIFSSLSLSLTFPLSSFFPKGRTRAIIRRQLKNRCPLNSPEGNIVRGAFARPVARARACGRLFQPGMK